MKEHPLLIVKKKSLFSKEISTFYFIFPEIKFENLIQILIDELGFSPTKISAIDIVFWDWRVTGASIAAASVTINGLMYQIEFFKDACKTFSEDGFIEKSPETYLTHENHIIRDFIKTLCDRDILSLNPN